MLLLTRVPQIAFADSWAAFGNPATGAWSGSASDPRLTPAGLAQEWIQSAARGSTVVRPIELRGGPVLGGQEPAVLGAAFVASDHGQKEILVNLSPRTVAVTTDSALPIGTSYRQAWGSPAHLAENASALQHRSGTVGASLSLPADSITEAG